jgi:glutathione S-transferase
MARPIEHYGWQVSPYSAKTRSYLEYIDADFKDVEPDVFTMYRRIQKAVGRIIMPTVRLPGGIWLQDSSAIIDHFEALPDTTSVQPTGPTQRLASALLEVFADEWMPMAALHYRWNIDTNSRFALTEFARSGLPWLPRILGRPVVRSMAGKMQSYLPLLGVTEATQPAVAQTAQIVLTCLEVQLQKTPFVLGNRPCVGDFALFGPLWAHLYRDPGSRHLFDDTPAVVRWMEMLSNQPTASGDFLADDRVPACLNPLFACILTDQWAWITTLEAAIHEYCVAHPEATRVPRALGDADFEIRGIQGRRKLVSFVQWKAQRARSAYISAGSASDPWLREVLDLESDVDVSRSITRIRHPFIMEGFKPILGVAANTE